MPAIKNKTIPLFLLLFFLFHELHAQHTFHAIVRDSITHEPLTGVSAVVAGTLNGNNSDINGKLEIKNIPDGPVNIQFSLVGYKKTIRNFQFPIQSEKLVELFLPPENVSLKEITVSTTRTNSRIEDLPVKMEVIGEEEVDEETSIEPDGIANILTDVAGLQVQQTSAVNGNTTIRIQGLDGKYTQFLRDGLPLYEGFSGSFGALDVPPLDLKQIEIIKGSASTLYGGGAIAGLINLISKEPADSSQVVLSLNQTSLKETNLNVFTSGRYRKSGITVLAGGTYQKAVDVNADGFSDQPQIKSISLHPRLFFYDHQSKKLAIGYSGMLEEKTGGDMKAIESAGDSLHSFFEKDKTFRNTIDFNFQSLNQKKDVITFKGAASLFSRTIGTKKSSTYFEGIDWSFFTELSYLKKIKQHTLVTGINFVSDFFNTAASSYLMLDKIRHFTGGLFIQDEWRFNDRFSTEVGLRFDHQQYNLYGEENFILPRISIIYGWSKHLTSRIGCGFGYKAADVFSNDDFIESGLLPQNIRAEKSFGSNGDLNYSTIIEQVSLVVNQSFFYTNIKNPIVESTAYSSAGFKENSSGYMDTKGSESYIRINYRDIDLYLGYVFSLPQLHQQGSVTDLPLTPENKFASTCVFEMENGWKAGIEASYIGQQHLYTFQNVDKKSPAYWIGALLLQKKISSLTMTLNCENIFDFRQSKIEEVVIPPFSSPTFKPVWAPLEGRVFNLSLKLLI